MQKKKDPFADVRLGTSEKHWLVQVSGKIG